MRFMSIFKQTRVQIALITLAFAGIFVGIRSMPNAQCAILHYEVTEETADGIEMCADGPAGMMDLNQVRFPGDFIAYSPITAVAGEPYQGEFAVAGPKGNELLPHEFAITHAEKLHLLVVDPTHSDFHHLHPTPIANTGRWEFSFTPRRSGSYDLYVEGVPLRTRKQLIVHTQLMVEPPVESMPTPSDAAPGVPLRLEWDFGDRPVRSGSWVDFSFTLKHPEGKPLALERFMDSYSHVVALREGTTGFAHMHPDSDASPADPTQASFDFTFFSGDKGRYRFWAQFQIDGQSIFIPHDVEVL
jgi:hypothetical protein